jgi:putative endonuclease
MKAPTILERLRRAWRSISGREPDPARSPADAAGAWGEDQAGDFLQRAGFRILHRRLRIGRRDEFDLVARDGAVLVFVEVKTRASEAFGRPFAAVDRRKRHALSRAAVRYLRKLGGPPPCFRFDVVEVVGRPGEPIRDIRHIRNAFPLDRRYRVVGGPSCPRTDHVRAAEGGDRRVIGP